MYRQGVHLRPWGLPQAPIWSLANIRCVVANNIHSAANITHIATNYSFGAANILCVQHPFSPFFEVFWAFQKKKEKINLVRRLLFFKPFLYLLSFFFLTFSTFFTSSTLGGKGEIKTLKSGPSSI